MTHRRLAALAVALLLASAFGLLAGLADPDGFWLRFSVFTLCCLPPSLAVGWYVAVGRHAPDRGPARPEETVEHQWFRNASSACFVDLVAVMGGALVVLSVADLAPDAQLFLVVLVLFGFADLGVRLGLAQRQAA